MMKRFFCVLTVVVCLVGCVAVSADTREIAFKDYDFSITVGDGVLSMNSETNKHDPVWLESGVENSEEQLDVMKQMNVLTMLYDKNTESLVNVICKITEATVANFSYVGKNDEEILASVDALLEGIDAPDENGQSTGVTYERSLVKHAQVPFFRIVIDIKSEEMLAKEVIYGTVVNGRLIEIDEFVEGGDSVDETFLKSVVDNLKITKFITKEEYEDMITRNKIKIWIVIGCVILMFAGLFIFAAVNRKRKEKKALRISENLRLFRERRANGEVDIKNVIAMGRATYSVKAVDKYITYNTWIRNAVVEVILFAFLVLIVVLFISTDSFLYGILVAICGMVSIYFNYTGGEKNKANMIARYDARNNPVARFTFYDEFFTITGAGAMTEFTYDQVSSVRLFNEYYYIFFGPEQGVFVERDSLGEEEIVKLTAHIKAKRVK